MAKKDGAAAPMTLEDWLNGRPSWLRMAAAGAIQHRRMPTEEELEALTTHCLAEAASTLETPHPPLAPGTILGTAAAADLRIDSVSSIQGVNAIGDDAVLDLSTSAGHGPRVPSTATYSSRAPLPLPPSSKSPPREPMALLRPPISHGKRPMAPIRS